MNKTVLQIPINTVLHRKAQEVAKEAGFSSVQEVIQVFLSKFATHTIKIGFSDYMLSEEAENQYESIMHEIKKGKNIFKPDSHADLISILKE